MSIDASELSRYRKIINDLVKEIGRLSTKCLYSDSLIHGIPNEVFRKCGNKNCKCVKGGEHRHGPYRVIQIPTPEGKKQVSLRLEQKDIWDKVKHYQYQINTLAELRKKFIEIGTAITKVIELRTEEFINDDKREGK